MASHYRKTQKLYVQRKKQADCPFCNHAIQSNIVYQDEHVFVIPNLTKYDVWELHDVTEHLLLIPKRHTTTLADLTEAEKLTVMNIASEYESKGYSVYARGVGFARRSVEHQHTHLIKADNKSPKFSVFLQKPYILVKK